MLRPEPIYQLGATLTGKATGRAAQTANGKPIPPAAVNLLFEFVDERGAVVASQPVAMPALKPGETPALSLRAKGGVLWGGDTERSRLDQPCGCDAQWSEPVEAVGP